MNTPSRPSIDQIGKVRIMRHALQDMLHHLQAEPEAGFSGLLVGEIERTPEGCLATVTGMRSVEDAAQDKVIGIVQSGNHEHPPAWNEALLAKTGPSALRMLVDPETRGRLEVWAFRPDGRPVEIEMVEDAPVPSLGRAAASG